MERLDGSKSAYLCIDLVLLSSEISPKKILSRISLKMKKSEKDFSSVNSRVPS